MALRKRKYKKVYKGKRYINKALKRYFGKRYPNASERQLRASELFNEIGSSSSARQQKVILENIFRLERKPSVSIPETPPDETSDRLSSLLDYDLDGTTRNLGEPFHYFDLETFSNIVATLSNKPKLKFNSTLSSSSLPPVEAGGNMPYQEYFSNFVRHINLVKAQEEKLQIKDGYETQWFVKCTFPVEIKKGQYETTIISCDVDGNKEDYQFNPDETLPPPTPTDRPKTSPAETPPSDLQPPSDLEPSAAQLSLQEKLNRAKELELRETELSGLSPDQKFELLKIEKQAKIDYAKTRQEQVGVFLKMFSEGKITKAEYKEFTRSL